MTSLWQTYVALNVLISRHASSKSQGNGLCRRWTIGCFALPSHGKWL